MATRPGRYWGLPMNGSNSSKTLSIKTGWLCLLLASFSLGLSACSTTDGPRSCVIPDPPTDMLEEIASGELAWAAPGTERWVAQVFAVMGWGEE